MHGFMTTTKRPSLIVSLSVLAAVLGFGLAPPSGSAQNADVAREVSGDWQLAEGDAESQIDRAVDRVTSQMNVFTRGIAQSRIDEALNPDRRVRLEADGEHVLYAIGNREGLRLPLSGQVVETTDDEGNAIRVRATATDGQLTIEERSERGTRFSYFQPRGNGLVVATRIRSERLPEDIVYRLQYRRASSSAVASR